MAEGHTPIDLNKDVTKEKTKTANKDVKNDNESLTEEDLNSVPSSPPKKVSMDELIRMRTRVEKMILTHEIAVQENFKLEKKQTTFPSIKEKVREIMEKAFWNVLDEELKEQPPCYNQALTLLAEIKQEFLEMLPATAQSMRSVIEEVLDIDLIRQKLTHNLFKLSTYSEFIIEIMLKMCAPVRDDHIEQLKNISQVVPLYQEIFRMLDLMKIDLANFTIKVAKPLFKQHSSDIERQKFLEILKIQQENGMDGLMYTKIWLTSSLKFVLAKQELPASHSSKPELPASHSSKQELPASQPPNPQMSSSLTSGLVHATISEAYLSLIFNEFNKAETLLMDAGRLLDLKNKLGILLFIAVTLAVSSAAAARQLDDEIKNKLTSQLLVLTQNMDLKHHHEKSLSICDQIVKELNVWLLEKGVSGMGVEVETALRSQVSNCLIPSSSSSAVFKLMSKRLLSFFEQVLSNPSQKDLNIPQGYSCLTKELTSLVDSYVHLITHNQSVYGVIYKGIISDLIRKNQKAAPFSTSNNGPFNSEAIETSDPDNTSDN